MVTDTTKLVDKLKEAKEIYHDTPRESVVMALDSVMEHLDGIGIAPDLKAPLFALRLALDDATRGAKNPLLEVKKLGHRPPFTRVERLTRTHAAAAMQLLVDSGIRPTQAAQTVASAVRNWPWHGAKSVLAANVTQWREDAMSGLVGEDDDATLYRGLTTDESVEALGPKAVADAILDDPPWVDKGEANPQIIDGDESK